MSAPVSYAGHTWESAREWCLWIMQHNSAPAPAQNGQTAALDAFRAEVIAEFENYPGELAMLRGVLGVVRSIARHGDLGDTTGGRELRQVITEHYADERDAYAEQGEKDTREGESTPQPATAGFTAVASPVEYGYVIAIRDDSHEKNRVPVALAQLRTGPDWSPAAADELIRSRYGYVTAPGSYWQPLAGASYGIRLRRAEGGDAR